jgi:carboxymethylenebutenolidase
MCDENTFAEYADLTRRDFGALSLGVGLACLLPRAANALEVTVGDVDVKTKDGVADCYFAHPTAGAHPGVMVWPDARGFRAVYRQIATRLAEHGYSVVVLNPFYRGKRAPVLPEGALAQDPATMTVLRPLLAQLNPQTNLADAIALMEFLDSQAAVDTRRKAGTMGYCLGGPINMIAAARFPERIGAAASFHGIRLVTDEPDSPHRLIAKSRAEYLIAIAEDDDMREPDAKNALRAACDAAMRPAEIEVYAGAKHSWCTADSPVHNPAQAERAWNRMLDVFGRALA